MKKTAICLCLALSVIVGMIKLGRPSGGHSATMVTTITAGGVVIYNNILCSGRVESVVSERFVLEAPAVVSEVAVRPGQRVQAGDRLFSYNAAELDNYPGELVSKIFGDLLAEAYAQSGQDILDAADVFAATGELPDGFSSFYLPRTDSATTLLNDNAQTAFAGIDGIVRDVYILNDTAFPSGLPCVVIENDRELRVRASVPEASARKVEVGQNVTITGAAFSPGAVYKGIVEEIMPFARQTGGLLSKGDTVVDVLIRITAPAPEIIIGCSATARIQCEEHHDAILLPYTAINQDDRGIEYVWKVVDGRAVRTDVTTGYETDTGMEILSGVVAGDTIITSAGRELYDGTSVVTEG